jgi:hypothetical protein
MFVPGWNELMLAMARRSVSCTRSSARSTLPLSEIANARRLGTAANMASRTAGEASSARSFVVRFVESLVVAPGRDSDAAIIFMDDLRHASQTASNQQGTVTRRTLKLLTKRPWEMSDIADVLETWEAATEAASRQRRSTSNVSLCPQTHS